MKDKSKIFQVFAAVFDQTILLLWAATPCSCQMSRRFEGTCFFHHHSDRDVLLPGDIRTFNTMQVAKRRPPDEAQKYFNCYLHL
jgi:hypothetical protein